LPYGTSTYMCTATRRMRQGNYCGNLHLRCRTLEPDLTRRIYQRALPDLGPVGPPDAFSP
jgi:hypothetical protein